MYSQNNPSTQSQASPILVPSSALHPDTRRKGRKLQIKPTLRADREILPAGGSVTLTCSVEGRSDLIYGLYRSSSTYQYIDYKESGVFIIREVGEYTCGGFNSWITSTSHSDPVIIQETVPPKPTVVLQPSWTLIYRGETVTATCQIRGGGGTQWKYEWLNSPETSREIRVSDSGEFSCRGRRDEFSITEWSDFITVTVSADRPAASLRARSTIIPAGGSVTLTCSVEDGYDGWSFDWFRNGVSVYLEAHHRANSKVIREGGLYICRGGRGRGGRVFYTDHSGEVVIEETLSPKPTVVLQPSWTLIYRGETVTATCQIRGGGGTQWKYEWRRNWLNISETSRKIRVSDSGEFSCRGRRDEFSITKWSDVITVTVSAGTPAASLRADRGIIPAGGSVTLTCSVEDGLDGWSFDWFRNGGSVYLEAQPETDNKVLTVSEGGQYTCRGGRGGEAVFYTENSREVVIKETHLSVPDRAESSSFPVLMVVGAVVVVGVFFLVLTLLLCRCRRSEVTLSCQLQHQDAGWSFSWYKAVRDRSAGSYGYKLLPVNTTGAEQGSYILPGQTHTAGYVCRAGRVDREYHSHYSEPQFVWSADLHPAASLTVSPDRVQHFRRDSVSLTCGGNSTTWRVKRFTGTGYLLNCISWGTMTGSRCEKQLSSSGDGVFWCESESGEFSNAVNISVQETHSSSSLVRRNLMSSDCFTANYDDGLILESPVHPVTEGASVSLSCRTRGRAPLSKVDFYHDAKLVQNSSRAELNISAVSQSDEGFYWCEASGRRSAQSWVSVKGNSTTWRVKRFTVTGYLLNCFSWGTMTGSRCEKQLSSSGDGVFWCESESGEFSNAVNISVQANYDDGLILESPVHPVTEGASVSLSCRQRGRAPLSKVDFYHDAKLVENGSRAELNISAVSQSDEGFYRCEASGRRSAQSWVSVKAGVSRAESSSFPVLMVVGAVVVGVFLLVLLLLSARSQSPPQSSSTNHEHEKNIRVTHADTLSGSVWNSPVSPMFFSSMTE
ncbi:unnamed protein product [Menidia menidia]|uniref:(Atlantic silverside) hypothetical protein n=1 Tax=Menidia menidia TaxID=238744 RepID=A0A8S4AUM4_9TELE|nr:unnamed protein product [Menidia menidia]